MSVFARFKYAFITALFYLISLVPNRILFFLSEVITLLVFYIVGYRRNVVTQNLQLSFPEKDEQEIKHIRLKYYRHLSVMVVENIKLRFISTTRFSKSLIVENKILFDTLNKQGKNIIVVMGHFGNWEYASGLTRMIPFKGSAVYKQLSDKAFDKFYFRIRQRLGVKPVEMRNAFKEAVRINAQDQSHALIMVADQSPGGDDIQYVTTFLNQRTGFYMGAAKLAFRFDMPVVYLELLRHKKGVYRAIPTLVCDFSHKQTENEITQKFVELLEQSINNSPRYWLWSHRRWKHKV